MPKFIQCDRLPRAPRKRSVPSVNDHPAIVDIFRKFFENGPCIQTISFLVTMVPVNTLFINDNIAFLENIKQGLKTIS